MAEVEVASPAYEDLCPITGQAHRYFIFKTFEGYEPTMTLELDKPTTDLAYYKREFAILGCNCGSVIKIKVQDVQNV